VLDSPHKDVVHRFWQTTQLRWFWWTTAARNQCSCKLRVLQFGRMPSSDNTAISHDTYQCRDFPFETRDSEPRPPSHSCTIYIAPHDLSRHLVPVHHHLLTAILLTDLWEGAMAAKRSLHTAKDSQVSVNFWTVNPLAPWVIAAVNITTHYPIRDRRERKLWTETGALEASNFWERLPCVWPPCYVQQPTFVHGLHVCSYRNDHQLATSCMLFRRWWNFWTGDTITHCSFSWTYRLDLLFVSGHFRVMYLLIVREILTVFCVT